jgi:hypothetical protein
MGSHDKNDAEESVTLSTRLLSGAIKFNIFTFILILFSTDVIYIPVLREYAKLGFDYGNIILGFTLIFYLLYLAYSLIRRKI